MQNIPSSGSPVRRATRLQARTQPARQNAEHVEMDQVVVRRVYDRCHQYIVPAVLPMGLPAEFLGALAANESGGNQEASCFEPGIYEALKAVASGQRSTFGSIGLRDLSAAFRENFGARAQEIQGPVQEQLLKSPRSLTSMEDSELRDLATSWSFTQIMGYQVVGRGAELHDLIDPEFHFRFAAGLLRDFARRFRLLPSRDFEALFRCWNTGHPDGNTFDPDYVPKGMRRMKLYRELVHTVAQTEHPEAT